MKKALLFIIGFVALLCIGCSNGGSDSIDYSSQSSWLALPGITSTATLTPTNSGLSSLEGSAPVDVFYIHPTSCTRTDVFNCTLDDVNGLSLLVMMEQASVFNAVGRIYAPKYRQMALYMYSAGDSPDFQNALSFAYQDVKNAFLYYMKNYNNGRPFIIASHSQGTDHARRLITEEVHAKSIQSQFVAAWTPGQPTPYTWFASDIPTIPPCTSAAQIGCISVWQSFGEGFTGIADWNATDVYWDGQKHYWVFATNEVMYNVNPLTWTTDTAPADASLNLGSVPLGVANTDFTGLYPGIIRAQNLNGYLSVGPVPLRTDLYAPITTRDPLVFHTYDYVLYWLNIRNNVRLRTQTYLQQQLHVQYPLITSINTAAGTVGAAFSYQITTVNTATTYSATGLPAGLTINSSTGAISGNPTTAGVYKVVLGATNGFGSGAAELAVTVNP